MSIMGTKFKPKHLIMIFTVGIIVQLYAVIDCETQTEPSSLRFCSFRGIKASATPTTIKIINTGRLREIFIHTINKHTPHTAQIVLHHYQLQCQKVTTLLDSSYISNISSINHLK